MSPTRHVALLLPVAALLGPTATTRANPPHTAAHTPQVFAAGGFAPVFPAPMMIPFQPWAPSVAAPWMAQGNVPTWGMAQEGDFLAAASNIQVPPTPERHVLRGHAGAVTCVAFSPSDATLASGSADTTVILWDLANKKKGATLRGHSARVAALAFAPRGGALATAGDDRTVILWDLPENRVRTTLRGHAAAVTAVAFAPDGMTLATGARDGRVKLWDAATGRLRTTIEGRKGPVWELIFTPDGATVMAGVFTNVVTLWDAATGEPKGTRRGWHHSETTSAASLVGKTTLALARGRDGRVWLKDCRGGTVLGSLGGHSGAVRGLAFGPGGTRLASGGLDRTVRVWNVSEEVARRDLIERRIRELVERRQRERERARERKEERDGR